MRSTQTGLEQWLSSKVSLGKRVNVRTVDLIVFVVVSFAAILARTALFEHESGDYVQFLLPWYQRLEAAGGFPGLKLAIGDYTPPYMVFLAALTYLPISPLTGIKLFSVAFDFILAIFAMKIVWQKWNSVSVSLAAYTVMLFLPTVLLNSAMWGQCDVIFVTFLVMSLYYFLLDRPLAGMICFSISFALKLQAIFLAPILVLLFLMGKVKLRHLLTIPAVYLLGVLPAWMAGRPLMDLLTIYFSQTGTYTKISMNAPSLYIFIRSNTSDQISMAAILLAGAAVLISIYILYRCRKFLDWDKLLLAAFYFSLLLPFLLPRMHERYFYLADVLSLVVAFCRPKRFYLPILVVTASFAGYIPFLFGGEPISLNLASCFMGVALVISGYDLFRPLVESTIQKVKK